LLKTRLVIVQSKPCAGDPFSCFRSSVVKYSGVVYVSGRMSMYDFQRESSVCRSHNRCNDRATLGITCRIWSWDIRGPTVTRQLVQNFKRNMNPVRFE